MASVPVLVSTLTWCTPFVRRATVVSSPVCDLRSSRSGDYSQNTGRWSCGDRMLDRRPAPPIEGATNAARGGDDGGDGSRGGGGSKGGRSGKRSSAGRGRAKPGRAAVGRVLHKLRSLPDGASSSEIGLALGAARPSQLSARDYTTVLTTLRSERKWRTALQLSEVLAAQPREEGAPALPNRLHYNALLAACADAARRRDASAGDAALGVLRKMEERGVAPDSRSFSAAVAAAEPAGAEGLLAEFESSALASDPEGAPFVYCAAMRASLRAGEWEAALSLVDRMRARGVGPDSHCLGAALEACRAGRDGERAEAELAAARTMHADAPHRLSGVLVSTAMGACVRGGRWESALAIFDAHAADLAAGSQDAGPDPFCYAAALAACRRGGQAARAVGLLARFEEEKLGGEAGGEGAKRTGGGEGDPLRATEGGQLRATLAHLREQTVGACLAAGWFDEAVERHRGARSPSDRSLVFALRACGQLGLLRGADASSTALQLHAAQPAADLAGQIEADEALLSALASCGAWPALLAAYDDLAAESKARRPCLNLAAQAARATDSDRAPELAALAAAA